MSQRPQPLTVERLEQMVRSWQGSRILLTAAELDVFSRTETPTSSAAVAEALGTAPRYTDRLLNALVALGVLEKRDGRFANTPVAAEHLVPGKPGHLLGLHHLNHMWDSWSRLTEVIRDGKPARALPNPPVHEDWVEAFIAAMQQFGPARAPTVIDRLDLTGVRRCLDVGGGSGAFSVELARRRPELEIVIFDLPEVIPLTRRYVEAAGAGERISYVEGDFLKDDLGSGFDLVLMSHVIHSNGPDDVQLMFRKAAAALGPGGLLVIHDFLTNAERTGPPWSVIFALNMLANTEQGDTYTAGELRQWLAEAGFSDIQQAETGLNSDLVTARKA